MKVIGNLTKDAIIRAAVSEGISVTQEIGSSVTFESAISNNQTVIYDSTNQKIVIGYRDQGNSNYGTAIVGTVSGNSISFGTPTVFESSSTGYMSGAFDSNNGKVVFCFRGASNYGRAVVGTVSGTSISFGSVANFESAAIESTGTAYDANAQRIVVAYRDDGNSFYGTAAVGTVSGTSISFGTPVVFQASASYYFAAVYDASAQKVVIGYRDDASGSAGTAIVGTVSGTSISFGTKQAFESGNTVYISGDYDSVNQKVVFAYQDSTNSSYGTAVVGTVSGTSISFGTPVVFNEGNSTYFSTTFDAGAGRFLISYSDDSNSSKGEAIVGTVSGTSISFGDMALFKDGSADYVSSAYDSNQGRVVIAYRSPGNSNYSEAVVFKVGYTQATGGTIADGKAVIVNANGTVSSVSVGSDSLGSAVTVDADSSDRPAVAYDTTNNKVVIAYGNNVDGLGYAVVGTVSGSSISFGTPVQFNGGGSDHLGIAFGNDKIFIVYEDEGNSSYGTGIVGTVSGTSISFGTEVVYNSGLSISNRVVYDSGNDKFFVFYRDGTNSYRGRGHVATVSGTSITYTGASYFSSGNAPYPAGVYDPVSGKIGLFFRDGANANQGRGVVITISGTTWSQGSWYTFNATTSYIAASYDSDENKIAVFYKDVANSSYGTAIAATISGTELSYGSEQVFADFEVRVDWAVYDSSAGKHAVLYHDATDGYKTKLKTASLSGTTFTFGSQVNVSDSTSDEQYMAYDSDTNQIIISYPESASPFSSKAVLFTVGSTNLTTENFVGFMDGAALDGTNGEILSSCSIARNQTSLTAGQTYFVSPTDGSLSTSAGSPSVTAGTAISSTEIIVKG